MNVRNHFLERYCERILNMEDKNEIKQYIVQNRDRLISECLKMFEHAEYIYSGQLWDNVTRNYYIRDNIILVTDTNNSALITLFRCDFGFPEKTNRSIVQDLKDEIRVKQDELKNVEDEISIFIEQKQYELDVIEKQLNIIEDQKKLLEQKRDLIKSEMNSERSKKFIIMKEIDKLALTLCSSMDYKKELLEGKLA